MKGRTVNRLTFRVSPDKVLLEVIRHKVSYPVPQVHVDPGAQRGNLMVRFMPLVEKPKEVVREQVPSGDDC